MAWCFRLLISVAPTIDVSQLQSKSKHVQSGKIVTITCSLEEGDPPLSFSWMKDGQPLTSVPGIKVTNQEFSSLLTISATSSYHSGNYYCKASNPVSWAVLAIHIFVDGIVRFLNES